MLALFSTVYIYRAVGKMFNEDAEWNDEEDALVLSKSVFGDGQKRTSSSNLTVCMINC